MEPPTGTSPTVSGASNLPPPPAASDRVFSRRDWGAMAVRAAAVPLSFLGQLVAAQALGTIGYGSWQALIATLDLLGYAAKLGLDSTGVRLAAEYQATAQWPRLRGLQRALLSVSLVSSLTIASLWCGLATGGDGGWGRSVLVYGALLLLANVMLEVAAGMLRGQGFPISSTMLFHIVRHVGPLALFSYVLIRARGVPAIEWAVQAQLTTTLLALVAVLCLLPHSIPPTQRFERRYAWGNWLRISFPLWIVSACAIVQQNAGVIIAQQETNALDAGGFAVASRLANFVGIGSLLVGITFAPRLARAHAGRRHYEFNRLVLGSSVFAIGCGAIVAGGEWLFAPGLLKLMGVDPAGNLAMFQLLIVAALLHCLGQACLQGLVMSGEPRLAAVTQIGLTLLFVVGTTIGFRFDGIRGAGYAAAAAALLAQPVWIGLLYRRQMQLIGSD
jgi:O-antigen/teichoic acid export membrane protein